ncbi:Metal-independent alpha-mannosidase [Trypanosoma melophagium]|uniref:Metal-independent alpha-mannosidase n=1 Tax=Trypanosoma melophagium TaxID=715481 RepID=UPI003519D825|nr:Metal-independent alpha-mannosidase [Trypanosoma melophagium]
MARPLDLHGMNFFRKELPAEAGKHENQERGARGQFSNHTKLLNDKGLAKLFENCFPNTLDTTVMWASRQDTFIITGGVNAMRLRDSMFQVLPYIRFARQDDKLMEMLHGSVRRHLQSVLIDPLR